MEYMEVYPLKKIKERFTPEQLKHHLEVIQKKQIKE